MNGFRTDPGETAPISPLQSSPSSLFSPLKPNFRCLDLNARSHFQPFSPKASSSSAIPWAGDSHFPYAKQRGGEKKTPQKLIIIHNHEKKKSPLGLTARSSSSPSWVAAERKSLGGDLSAAHSYGGRARCAQGRERGRGRRGGAGRSGRSARPLPAAPGPAPSPGHTGHGRRSYGQQRDLLPNSSFPQPPNLERMRSAQ